MLGRIRHARFCSSRSCLSTRLYHLRMIGRLTITLANPTSLLPVTYPLSRNRTCVRAQGNGQVSSKNCCTPQVLRLLDEAENTVSERRKICIFAVQSFLPSPFCRNDIRRPEQLQFRKTCNVLKRS